MFDNKNNFETLQIEPAEDSDQEKKINPSVLALDWNIAKGEAVDTDLERFAVENIKPDRRGRFRQMETDRQRSLIAFISMPIAELKDIIEISFKKNIDSFPNIHDLSNLVMSGEEIMQGAAADRFNELADCLRAVKKQESDREYYSELEKIRQRRLAGEQAKTDQDDQEELPRKAA